MRLHTFRVLIFIYMDVYFQSYILGHMSHVINVLGYDPNSNESVTTTLTRQEIMHFACNLGHEGCRQNSRNKFVEMRDNGAW